MLRQRILSRKQEGDKKGGYNNTPTQQKKTALNLSPERIYKMIEKRAFEIYCSRGNKPGDHISDWLMAEKEILPEKHT